MRSSSCHNLTPIPRVLPQNEVNNTCVTYKVSKEELAKILRNLGIDSHQTKQSFNPLFDIEDIEKDMLF